MSALRSFLAFLGGLGLFLYGMEVMADGLSQAAGTKTRKLLELLTKNRLSAVIAGALVTAIIQSSSAVTVMVVGFVNASLMTLIEAAGVIMGANIGTTMTAWIVSMGEWAAFLKPEVIAPALLFGGVALQLLARSSRLKDGSRILIGFGMLFMGLAAMSSSIAPYTSLPIFADAFRVLGSNPILGVLTGALVTAVIQSSSASMGILQTLALSGAVNWSSAVYLALGQNIGTCVTALLSSVSGDLNAKRAAMIHLEFNTIGALLAGAAATLYFFLVPSTALAPVGPTSLALFHTGFNLAVTAVLFPFAPWLVRLSKILVPDSKKHFVHDRTFLDPRFLPIPEAALSAVDQEMERIAGICKSMIEESGAVLIDHHEAQALEQNSRLAAAGCRGIRSYLEKIDPAQLTPALQQQILKNLLRARDLLQISVSCRQIGQLSESAQNLRLHPHSKEEINTLSSLCLSALQETLSDYPFVKTEHQTVRIAEKIYAQAKKLSDQNALVSLKTGDTLEEAWLLMEISDLYLQIARRILRFEDEGSWHNPGLISFQAH